MNEIDRQIAELIFEQPAPTTAHHEALTAIYGAWQWTVVGQAGDPAQYTYDEYDWIPLPFSADIASAMSAVEKILESQNWSSFSMDWYDGPWVVMLIPRRNDEICAAGSADELPLAICRCLLDAVGRKVEEEDEEG